MVIQYKNISKVKFPVYAMPSGNWYRQDGLLFLDEKILDDKNMEGDTLGIRRLQTPHKNLQELHHQLDNFRGILKSKSKHFVDSYGIPFIYEKSQFCRLKYYRIKRIVNKTSNSLLYLEGIKNPFVIPRPPANEIMYAGVLHYGNLPWVLYDYSETKLKDTRRKV